MEKVIYIFRHGQTDGNLIQDKKIVPEEPLNEKGQQQAHMIAENLEKEKEKPHVILSSEIPRATQTAGIVGDALHIPVQTDSRLNEYNFGIYIGKAVSNNEIYKDCQTREEAYYLRLPEGESDEDVVMRIKNFYDFLLTLPYSVAICTHNYPAFVLMQFLKGHKKEELVHIPFEEVGHGAYTKFVSQGSSFVIVTQ